jgi:8-oxo-dGTP diphosphatase
MGRQSGSGHPAITVDVVAFTLLEDDLQALLIRSQAPPSKGRWAIPSARIRDGEPLETTARCILEGYGAQDMYLEQLCAFGNAWRDPRGRAVAVAYLALVTATSATPAGGDASDVRWWSIYKLPPLALDHAQILDFALQRLRNKLEYTAVGFRLLPPAFTLTETQRAYEVVLGSPLDKRNFRRRILEAGIIGETRQRGGSRGRPARLYRLRDDAMIETKARRLFP